MLCGAFRSSGWISTIQKSKCMTIKLKLRVLNVCVTNECLNMCSRHLDIEEARQRQTERIPDEMFYMNSEDKMSPEDYK